MLQWLKRWLLGHEQPTETEQISREMKYLMVGLGNIGSQYVETRHNIGFDVVDAMAKANDAAFKEDSLGSLAEFKHKGRSITLLKPNTYMNLSGKAVRYWLQKKDIPKENLLVIHDDLNLPLCRLRLRGKASDGGHNGLKSIDEILKTNEYARLRFGIGNNFPRGKQVAFVLGKWTNEEFPLLAEAIQKAGEAALSFASVGLAHSMTAYNK
jgi:PTH1 family peptidyl-tRNA hydrolase